MCAADLLRMRIHEFKCGGCGSISRPPRNQAEYISAKNAHLIQAVLVFLVSVSINPQRYPLFNRVPCRLAG